MRTILIAALLVTSCASVTNKMVMPERAANNLTFLSSHVETEFAFCVFGNVTGNGIEVDHIELPYIEGATHDSVTWSPCAGPNFLGIGHSHPKDALCQFSDMDFKALVETDAPFGFLLCEGGEKMVWYGKRHVLAQMKAGSRGH